MRLAALLGLALLLNLPLQARIIEVDRAFPIAAHSKRIDVVVPIQNEDGWLRYRLICRGGSDEYMKELSKAKHVNYVGPLMCMLQEGNWESENSLLAEDSSPPWHTRGQFHWGELLGACGEYPEYGRIRHFSLRGMQITLEARQVEVKADQLDSFVLHVTFKNDDEALSRHALRPPYMHPQGSCEEVRKGIEPRMCRNAMGSWEKCQSGDLLPLDKRVLEFALARNGSVYDDLRAQVPYLKMESRSPDSIGYHTYFEATKGVKPAGGGSVFMMIDDVKGRTPEVADGIIFLIRVEDGLIVSLEGVTLTSDYWPEDEARIRLEISPRRTYKGQELPGL